MRRRSSKLRRIIRRLSNSSEGVVIIMMTLGVCDFLVCGFHDVGARIEHHNIHVVHVQTQQALADGDVIRPTVSAKVKHGFANRMAQLNASLPKQDRVTPSLVIAQAALESNWGQSEVYKEANNPFGMKGAYHGKYLMYATDEYNSKGKGYTEMSDWKQYPSLEDAVRDHNLWLKHKFLAGSQPHDYVSEAKALQINHYATDPNYAQKIMREVQNNNLTRFD